MGERIEYFCFLPYNDTRVKNEPFIEISSNPSKLEKVMKRDKIQIAFHKKLIVFYISLLLLAIVVIGVASHMVARTALTRRGEEILENGVYQALMLVDAQQARVEAGVIDKSTAMEEIKAQLMGPMQEDGTRLLNSQINLGEHGYFIIYDTVGNEVMHPTIEGDNVWQVKDLNDDQRFIVQEQIQLALDDGGIMYYNWTLPNSEQVAPKISFGRYDPEWEWIVVATAYKMDFNSEADDILTIMLVLGVFLVLGLTFIISRYILRVTDPIVAVADGMEDVAKGEFITINPVHSKDEIEMLVDGYNDMITNLAYTKKDLEIKTNRITYLAYHDDLTGLPNFHGMKKFVDDYIASDNMEAYLIQTNIIGLKVINAMMGYEQGNNLLKNIGQFFNVETHDYFVARTSSNEFSLWIVRERGEEIKDFIGELRSEVKEYVTEEGFGQLALDINASAVLYPLHGESFDELYEKATIAMKKAKDEKAAGFAFYNDDLKESIEDELVMRKLLDVALANKEICAYYQEKVDYTNSKIVGVEALARWISSEIGFVSPATFIPAIHALGMTNEFNRYMFQRVLSEYDQLVAKYGTGISVSVNITPSTFMEESFVPQLAKVMTQYGIPHNVLILELTEDIFMSDEKSISSVTDQLHELGVKISIDDFGTGYSSLSYLTRINLDEMKIDKGFIDQILDDPKAYKLFKVMCNIAEIYGYDIVAEGVETMEQLELIKGTSLRVIQGYLFSKPAPL